MKLVGLYNGPVVGGEGEGCITDNLYLDSLVSQRVENLPEMQETRVLSVGQEDLDEGITTHSSILAWRIPCSEEPGRLQSMGCQRVRHN